MQKSVGTMRTNRRLGFLAHRRVVTSVVLLVSLAACGGTPSTAKESTLGTAAGAAAGTTLVAEGVQVTEPPANASETTVGAAGGGAVDIPELLQFTAPLVGGGEFNGAERAGQATAFWFWAPT